MTLKSITTTILVGMYDLGKLECTAGLTCNCYKLLCDEGHCLTVEMRDQNAWGLQWPVYRPSAVDNDVVDYSG